jgi:HK97 gp10 family phage protein
MGLKISINMVRLKQDLVIEMERLRAANRPAAQAGAQIVYERAKQHAPVSDAPHRFHGTHAVYGPYSPGNLRDSIYQAFSKDNSFLDNAVYHVSWNADKAPYGGMVELGTSTAAAHPFIGRAVAETRSQVIQAIRQRYVDEVTRA